MEPVSGERIVGNIYKGRVVRVLPGMQSAFIEIGLDRTAFLFAGDLADNNGDDSGDDPESAESSMRQIAPIADRLSEGQDVIVQVAKEPMGTKGARVTSQITLPGRHVVYMPTVRHVGVSRRIHDEIERDRLRSLAEAMNPEEGGIIVRTAGEGFEEDALREDLDLLLKLWSDICQRADSAKPPTLLHQDLDLALQTARDLLRPDFEALYVDDVHEYDRLATFLERFMPGCRHLLRLDEEDPPLFTRFGVEHDISRAMGRKVWLKSGGSIVIDQTEALTAIDVNTGRYVGKSNFEDTVLKANLEAVREIAYQLRLRNIGGIIVIDFIDMAKPESRDAVYDALCEALSHDKVRTRVLPMSQLGLIEMTRKRVRQSLNRMMAQSCRRCEGRGWTLSANEVARQVLVRVRDTIGTRRDLKRIEIQAHSKVVEVVYDDYREQLESIEQSRCVEIEVTRAQGGHVEHFDVKAR
jgi:ribonuclease G